MWGLQQHVQWVWGSHKTLGYSLHWLNGKSTGNLKKKSSWSLNKGYNILYQWSHALGNVLKHPFFGGLIMWRHSQVGMGQEWGTKKKMYDLLQNKTIGLGLFQQNRDTMWLQLVHLPTNTSSSRQAAANDYGWSWQFCLHVSLCPEIWQVAACHY